MAPRSLVLLTLVAAIVSNQHANAVRVYKVCASERVPSYTCAGLNKGNTEVSCARVVDSADCLRQLVAAGDQDASGGSAGGAGAADFAVLSAEEVLLASKFAKLNNDTRVIAEIRHSERVNEPFAFETVVIVKSDYSGLLTGLKDKKLCHPGFSDSQMWTNRILKYFERKVVPQTCNRNVPRVEEEYDNLANFFKAACIPGDWTRNEYRDKILKAKHPQLCALCDNPERCSYDNQRFGSHEAALACLTKSDPDLAGDVAYVALQYAQDYFGLKDRKARANPDNYRFLCTDGSMQTINSAQPCTWLKQPWGAIVAKKSLAVELQSKLKTWLPSALARSSNKDTWQSYLLEIVFPDSSSRLVDPPTGSTALAAYMARGRNDTLEPQPAEGAQCRASVRWCVTTPLEAEKCEVLRQGAFTYGLEPNIRCVQGANMWDCMAAVRNMTADILSIDTEYSLIARQTFALSPLIYQETGNDRAYQIVAVVRAESGVAQLSDLKKKAACFPEYGGLGWVSWVDTARTLKLLPRKCPSAVAVAGYFQRACAPGADDSAHNPNSDINTRTALCALCPENKENPEASKCETSAKNSYYSDTGAMRCLNDKRGDVAFIDLRAITDVDNNGVVSLRSDYRADEYRVLCRNGTVSKQTGLLVDSRCALASGITGEVVCRNLKEVLSIDAALLLVELEHWFGFGAKHYESALNMFGQFKGIEDVIFRRSVAGFVSIYDRENILAADFSSLMERNTGCNLDGSAAVAVSPLRGLVLALALCLTGLAALAG